MALNSSGQISLGGTTVGQSIEKELGGTGTSQISFNDSNVRTLAGVPTGQISMPTNFYGKNAAPTWITPTGSLGSNYTQRSSSFTVSATSSFGVTYSLVSGSLPTGQTLNSSTGVISGTPSGVPDYSSTTFNFTIRATSTGTSVSVDRAFSILIYSRYVGYRCSTAGENGTCSDTAPGGYVFNRVDFSSYGTPNGSCGAFTIGGCNSVSSNNYNPTPTASYAVGASNGVWGDPCGGTAKRMYIQMSYGPF